MASGRNFDATIVVDVLLAVMAAVLVYTGTPWGPGLTPDSVAYVGAARTLSHPGGWWLLTSQWPPLYPATIAAGVWIFGNVVSAGRWLQAIFAALNLLLLARVFRRCGVGNELAWPILALLALQPGFICVHMMMWSEPEFLTLVLLDLLLLERALREPDRGRWTAALALVCGASVLVRYAGLFLLAVNAMGLMAFGPRDLLRRLRTTAFVTAASAVPFLAWLVFNQIRGATGVNRQLAWHPPGKESLDDLRQTLSTWSHLPHLLSLLTLVLLLVASYRLIRQGRGESGGTRKMTRLAMLCLFGYAAFILVSISFVDGYTPLDERILFPVLPLVLVVFASVGAGLPKKWHGWCLMAPVFMSLLLNVGDGVQWWRNSRAEGVGFARQSVQAMPVLPWLSQVPAEWPIATNSTEMFTLYSDKNASVLPSKYAASSGQANPEYVPQMLELAKTVRLVVYFHALGWREYLPTPRELDRLPGFRLVYSDKDAMVWARQGP